MVKPILATRVVPVINKSVRKLTRGLGISISEYLRRLIFQDLDSRRIFNDELKKAVEEAEEDYEPKHKPIRAVWSQTELLRELKQKRENELQE